MGRRTGSWSTTAAGSPTARSRPLRAAALSALLPGAGQVLAGRRRRGAWMLGGVVVLAGALVGLAAALYTAGPEQAIGVLARTETLLAIVVANLAVGVVRLAAGLDAWWVARSRGRVGAPGVIAVCAVLAVLVVVPHAGIALGVAEAQRVVDAAFLPAADAGGGHAEDAYPAPRPGPDPTRTPTPAPTPTATPSAPPTPLAEDDGEAVAPPDDGGLGQPAPLLDGRERFTVLLLGSDAGPGRFGARVDVMVVATMDVDSGAISLISVPRNLAEVPMPPGPLADRLGERYPLRLMSLYPEAAGDPVLVEAFAEPGMAAISGAVSALLDLPIDHVAMVDMGGFVDVVDALGGVEVAVDEPIRLELSPAFEGDEPRAFDIPAGRRWLDGQQALAYVRSREGTDDYDRMRRQRCLLGSIVRETDPLGLVRAAPSLADVVAERVRTDVPTDMLPEIARLAFRAELGGVRTLGITPPAYTDGRNAEGFFQPDLERVRADVAALLEAEPVGTSEDLEGTCG